MDVDYSTSDAPNPLVSTTFLEPNEVALLLERFTTRNRRPPNDPFFSHTNQLLGLDTVPGMQRLGVYSTLEDRPLPVTGATPTACNVPGCNRSFDTDHAFERHYTRSHRFQCSQCHRMLPSEHLLDLHLSEEHDSFFAARLAAQPEAAWFVCFLKECETVSRTPDERKDHCIRAHRFPSHFRFDSHSNSRATVLMPIQSDSESAAADVSSVSDGKSSGGSPVRFVNFGHSKQKTFQTKKSHNVDNDYARALTKNNRKEPNGSTVGTSCLEEMSEPFVADMLASLE